MANTHITLQSGSALVRIPLSSIRYLESRRHYVMIHAQCGTFRIRGKISDYASRLKDSGFVQTHRCYVVRWVSVVEVHHAYVELEEGTRIPLGRRFRASIAAGR